MKKATMLTKNRKLIKVWLFILLFLGIGSYFFLNNNKLKASSVVTQGDFRLTAEQKWSAQDKKSYVDLAWDAVPDLSVGYKMYQSEDAIKWNMRSLNYGKPIKVLNIYPNVAASNTLKTWMDGLGLKSATGENLIQVTAVSIADYNNNPVKYLKDANSEYQYDVLMFGSYDSNAGLDLTATSAAETKKYSDTGKGILFGHDTVYYGRPNFFNTYKDLLGVGGTSAQGISGQNSNKWTGSQYVKLIDDGYLMKYPFELENNQTFQIPYAHNIELQNTGVGTTWMEFVSPSGLWPNAIYQNGVWRGGWYLKTNDNLGMIQTGHSNGQSNVTERQIIANALYNLAQVSKDTSAQDQTVKDNVAPDLATIVQTDQSSYSSMEFDIDSIDQGKEYQWYVEASTYSSGKKKSDVVKETITSNIAGYFYKIDTEATSTLNTTVEGYKDAYGRISVDKYDAYVAPTGTTDTSDPAYDATKDANLTTYDTKATIKGLNGATDSEKYIHIVSVDRANNVSKVKTVQVKDIMKKFRITEKYIDTDGNKLQEDTYQDIAKNATYTQSFASIDEYSPNSFQINNETPVYDETTVSIENVTSSNVVTYIYSKEITLNIRQISIGNVGNYTIPKNGYALLSMINTSSSAINLNAEVFSETNDEENVYTKVIVTKVKGYDELGIGLQDFAYFKNAGYILTTSNTSHKQENKIEGVPVLDITAAKEFWITVYMEPTLEENQLPRLYSWDYKENDFGFIEESQIN